MSSIAEHTSRIEEWIQSCYSSKKHFIDKILGTDLDPNDTANPNDPGDFAQANAIPVNVDDFEEAQNQSGHESSGIFHSSQRSASKMAENSVLNLASVVESVLIDVDILCEEKRSPNNECEARVYQFRIKHQVQKLKSRLNVLKKARSSEQHSQAMGPNQSFCTASTSTVEKNLNSNPEHSMRTSSDNDSPRFSGSSSSIGSNQISIKEAKKVLLQLAKAVASIHLHCTTLLPEISLEDAIEGEIMSLESALAKLEHFFT